MGIITPLLDVVAGVAILAGRSSLLDTGVFKTANTNFTIRHILALGFIGVGVWNLWKIERAQDKLKKSLGAESFGADESNRTVKYWIYRGLRGGGFSRRLTGVIFDNREEAEKYVKEQDSLLPNAEHTIIEKHYKKKGELNAESFGAEPMFVESDSLMVELMGFDGSYRTDGEVKVGYTTAAELGFEPKQLKPVMWVWDDIEGYGAFMPTEKIRFIAEYFE